ncbi:sensor histidine kinase [Nocardioides campestrisoli]|uniref:sensor histidine kinase n=1 Tax=Nocardioides campestrisoli TaxID=2736757 RepID=UPI001CD522C5|nr:histidine kinase [Nocardioides campestrisoli]
MPRPAPSASQPHQPSLGVWDQVWRLLVCLLASLLVWGSVVEGQWEDHRALWWTDVVVGLASYVLVLFRRRWPLTVALLTQVMMIGSGIAAGPATLSAVSLATHLRLVPIAVTSVAMVAAGMAFPLVQPFAGSSPWWLDLAFNTAVTVALMGWGMYLGSRRQLIGTLRERAERAETEQTLRESEARSAERTRIAREMHDVLAHRISQISLQSGALAFRDDLDADTLRAGVAEIREKSHQALDDLRGVLGVLRDLEGTAPDRPLPTYAAVRELVEEACAEGTPVVLEDRVEDPALVPEVSGRAVYRIVQEGITNARKHAPAARLEIQLAGDPEQGLSLRLSNRLGFATVPAAPGSGLGLVGLAERAQARGGRLTHGRQGDVFVVEGWLPWTT